MSKDWTCLLAEHLSDVLEALGLILKRNLFVSLVVCECVCGVPVCTQVEAGTGHQGSSFIALHLIALMQGLLTHPFG